MEIKVTKEEMLKAILINLFTRTGMRVQPEEAKLVYNINSIGIVEDFIIEIDK